ncbi:MAG: hypothetical protein KC431_06965 [Myxococcales bacterium]|nr:hypothetical protein [Myxococcales bacterium]
MAERLDVGSLLTIDVESELRKLTQAQLQGPWQLPAELVRRALRGGATRIEVELGRSRLSVRSEGDCISYEVLRELAALLDDKRQPERRHRALSTLERLGALSLLGLVGLEPGSLQIATPAGSDSQHPLGLEWKRGSPVVLQRFSPPGPRQTEIILRGAKLDRTRAREWLIAVARHAPAPIIVDGRPLIPEGVQRFEGALSVTRLEIFLGAHRQPCTLAIPREGEVARIFLLQDGLLSAHMSVTDAPAFEAALETRGLPGLGASASAATLRDVVGPHVQAVVDGAIGHMIDLCERGLVTDPRDRSRLTQLLLTGARRRRGQARTIAQLPLFRSVEPDGRERWSDLLALRQTVQDDHGEKLLTALFPDQDLAEFAPEGRVYILDESERASLGELLELGFRPPRRRLEHRRGLARLVRDGGRVLRGQGLLTALRPGGRPIPDGELTVAERGLLIQLRAALEGCEVAMCTGSGPVRRMQGARGKLLLPRGSRQVAHAVVAVSRDPGWVYPSLLALLDGREFPLRARRRWRFESWG